MSKRYTVRYHVKGKPIITAVSNISDLTDLLNGAAKSSNVETKMNENMPVKMHNLIGNHNFEIEFSKSKPNSK